MGICQEDHGYMSRGPWVSVKRTMCICQEDHGYLSRGPWVSVKRTMGICLFWWSWLWVRLPWLSAKQTMVWDKRIMIAGCKCKDQGCGLNGPVYPTGRKRRVRRDDCLYRFTLHSTHEMGLRLEGQLCLSPSPDMMGLRLQGQRRMLPSQQLCILNVGQ